MSKVLYPPAPGPFFMRIVLVGSPGDRARLRAELNGSMRLLGEFDTLAAAQGSGLRADAILMTTSSSFDRLRTSEQGDPARPEPFDPPLILSSSKDERLAQDRLGERRASEFKEALTAREIQVLELLAEGLPNKAIAGRLGISDQTVKFHVSSISGKLGAANRTEAVRRAVRRGLITL